MKNLLASLACLAMTVNPILAGSCRIVAPVRQHYVAPVYHAPVKKVVVEEYHAPHYEVATYLRLLKPSYYGQYVAPPAQMSEDELTKAIQGLSAELNALKERLGAPHGPDRSKPAPMPGAVDPFAPQASTAALLQTTAVCAACHDAREASKKGGSFTLLRDGKLVQLTPDQLGELVDRLTTSDPTKAMPPLSRGKVTAETKLGILEEILRK